jgi:hypothetical protein
MLFTLLLPLLLLLTTLSLTHASSTTPTVGVIRWDAWNQYEGQYDPISKWVYKQLTPVQFQYRLPFFAKVAKDQSISFDGNQQSIMDAEIDYATHAGINYWMFDTYCAWGPNCTTSSVFCKAYIATTSHEYCPRQPTYGLDLYLASKNAKKMNFTLLLLGAPTCDLDMQAGFIKYMSHPLYQKVLGNRPLVYLFQFSDQEARDCAGGWAGSKVVFDNFRRKVQAAGLANPYLVLMDFEVGTVKSHAQQLGFDAISTYALPGGTDPIATPFSVLQRNSQNWWNAAAGAGIPFVPMAPTGWDPRPRSLNPDPTVDEGPMHFAMPTGPELQNFITSAINFTCAHKPAVEAQTVIIYAWNELTENAAAIAPTLGNGTLYVDAMSHILPMTCP